LAEQQLLLFIYDSFPGKLRSDASRWSVLWTLLTGDSTGFTLENRAFNAVSIITIALLLALLPFNIYMGLLEVSVMLVLLIILLGVLYYYSRFRKQYAISMNIYAITSYAALILVYFYNSGSLGPTIYLFFLTFQLLIAFTRRRWHIVWILTHLLIPVPATGTRYLPG
jgi:two-component system, sensor histidine kinase and response regulator